MADRAPVSYGPRPSPASSSLYDVLDLILDKGLVIDAYVRVSLVGIELITVDARIVIASVDTYLRFAEATNRLDLEAKSGSVGLPDLFGAGSSDSEGGESVPGKMAKKGVDRVAEHVVPGKGGSDEGQQEQQSQGEGQQQ